ncbi:MAG: hypothetical protein IPP61_19755 [Cytophagaceae bacterium]|nr:hypothetical protein [Cytophagaceae bacterium]MBK9933974.1 hypothetical protein [Cytophagaceae bacterium]MBL0327363.1 hypothetical protein [Cytophagaceae bacterium]
MLRNILLALIAVVFVSCHKKLAFFQPGKSVNYHSEKIPSVGQSFPETNTNISPNQPEITASIEGNLEFESTNPIEIVNIEKEIIQQETSDFERTKNTEFNISEKNITEKTVEKNTLKRKKLYPLFNDNLKIGLVFLVIAAILAIFSLNQLVLIFGLASLVFLYLGLKKYYRRKRIKSIFKK